MNGADFQEIMAFLLSTGDEVRGHDEPRLDPQIRSQLEQLARGECTEKEREELCRIMARRPEYVTFLAENIKQLRKPTPPPSPN